MHSIWLSAWSQSLTTVEISVDHISMETDHSDMKKLTREISNVFNGNMI